MTEEESKVYTAVMTEEESKVCKSVQKKEVSEEFSSEITEEESYSYESKVTMTTEESEESSSGSSDESLYIENVMTKGESLYNEDVMTEEESKENKFVMTEEKSEGNRFATTVKRSEGNRYATRVKRRSDMKYQLYHLSTEFILVDVLVKESKGIPLSIRKYSVRVAIEKSSSEGKKEKQTSESMAWKSPKWNEKLTFLVKKQDWQDQDGLMLEFTLFSTDFINNVLMVNKKLSMKDLIQSRLVRFEDKVIKIGISTNSQTDVKFRTKPRLCRQEKTFVRRRKKAVLRKMKTNTNLKSVLHGPEDVPHIAIIGSGGGMRAVIGMCGAMVALQEEGILDYTMYIAGLSGSAWYLTTLYAHGDELNPKAVSKSIRHKLQNSFAIRCWKAWYSWKYYTKSKAFSHGKYLTMTDTFGEMIGAFLLKKKCKQKWSEQRTKLKDGKVPLPLIAALHVRNEETVKQYHEWIELSPYEALIPKYGAAIDMRTFGDRFHGGFITKKYGEQPIHFLQGLVGSAYAVVKDLKPSGNGWYMCSRFKEWIYSLFSRFDEKFVAKVPNLLYGEPRFTPLTNDTDQSEDLLDVESKQMMIVDAGIAFNSPYPAVLHPGRKVDLILSFDFTDRGGDDCYPFKELELAHAWAKERNIPFPDLTELVDIKERGPPYENLYIFKGFKGPTIMHFVMINNEFRKQFTDSSDRDQLNFEVLPKYGTLRFSYSDEEFDKLKSLIEYNAGSRKKEIIDCIRCVIEKK